MLQVKKHFSPLVITMNRNFLCLSFFLENSHGGGCIMFVHNCLMAVDMEKAYPSPSGNTDNFYFFSCCQSVKQTQNKEHIFSSQIFKHQLTSWWILPFSNLSFYLPTIQQSHSSSCQKRDTKSNKIQSNQFSHFLICLVKGRMGMDFEVTA